MDQSLRKLSKNRFAQNPFGYIALGVLFCIFTAASIALSLLVPFLGSVAVVFLVFPLFFGTILSTSAVEYFDKVSFKNLLGYSIRYYHPQFLGCFRLLWCLLRGIIVEFGAMFITGIICFIVAKIKYPVASDECFNALVTYLVNPVNDAETFNALFEMHNGFLLNIYYILVMVSGLSGAFIFIVSVAFNAIGAFYRMLLKPTSLMFGKTSINAAITSNRKIIFKDFLLLNWPLILLCFIGLVTGACISTLVLHHIEYGLEFGCIFAFVFMAIHFPKYLANMNALFDKHKFLIAIGINDSIKKAIKKIQLSVDLSEDDKQKIQDTLNQLDEETKELEDENKKDSTE